MEDTAQREVDLHAKASSSLKQAGYQATPRELNPNDQSALERIQEAMGAGVHVVDGSIKSLGGDQTNIETGTIKGGRLARWVKARFGRK